MNVTLQTLRERVRLIERPSARHGKTLAFGVAAMDDWLPGGGLALGALHEIGGAPPDAGPAACATLFAAGIAARTGKPVLWCGQKPDLFVPGLACAGLAAGRVIHAETGTDTGVLQVMEEGLRHPGLGAVIGEIGALPITASRRLALAAEKSGVMALALCRQAGGPGGKMKAPAQNTACTRWCIGPHPSPPLAVPGLARARWQVALLRARGGSPKTWILEGCDAQGRLSVPADMAYRPIGIAQDGAEHRSAA